MEISLYQNVVPIIIGWQAVKILIVEDNIETHDR